MNRRASSATSPGSNTASQSRLVSVRLKTEGISCLEVQERASLAEPLIGATGAEFASRGDPDRKTESHRLAGAKQDLVHGSEIFGAVGYSHVTPHAVRQRN